MWPKNNINQSVVLIVDDFSEARCHTYSRLISFIEKYLFYDEIKVVLFNNTVMLASQHRADAVASLSLAAISFHYYYV